MSNAFQVVTEFAVLVGTEGSNSDPNLVMQNQLCHKFKYTKVQEGLVLILIFRMKVHL